MKKSKSMKVAEYLLANPSAIPKEVATKFKCALPLIYAIRKRVLSGSMLDKAHPVVDNKVDQQQVGGTHYKDMGVQPWIAMEAWMTPEQFAGFLRGNAIKYLARCDVKGGIADIKKARHYIDKLVEVREDD